MPKKKSTARATPENASSENGWSDLHIDAGYTYSEECIDELLGLAGANISSRARHDLLNALKLAQVEYEYEKDMSSRSQPHSKQIEQFEKSVEKTRTLLKRLRGYHDFRNIGFVVQQIGRGAVTADLAEGLPRNPSITDRELLLPSFDGKVVGMNIDPLLRAALLAARRRRRGRGARKKAGNESIVSYAEDFFSKYAPIRPSTTPKNRFHEFAERFYEVVTKTEPGSLDRQIRSVFAAKRSGR